MSESNCPQVNLAVCGVFHYRHYVRYLADAGVLGQFYYSHRRSTDANVLGIPNRTAVNLPAVTYLTHGHLRVLRHRFANQLFPRYQDLWEAGVIRSWKLCDLLHTVLHGTGGRLIRHAQRRGAKVLGEPVNAHPVFVQELMREEYDRLGIPDKSVRMLNTGQRRTASEAKQCDRLLVPSRFVAKSYMKQGHDADRIDVLPWGTDLTQFSPGERAADQRFRVLCIAQISPRKGHVDLLDAWERLNLPNAELVLAGAITPAMEPLLRSRRHLFTHAGTVPHAEVAKLYRSADVVVLPSIEDGFSYVPLEAMACGVPVIVSANAGAAEIVEDSVTGFVVPARDPNAIAERLERLYRNPDLRRTMGDAAASTMQRRSSWADYAKRLQDCYHTYLSSSGQPRSVDAL